MFSFPLTLPRSARVPPSPLGEGGERSEPGEGRGRTSVRKAMTRLTARANAFAAGRPWTPAAFGVVVGAALTLAFGGDVAAAARDAWTDIVLPAFHALTLSGFATCF